MKGFIEVKVIAFNEVCSINVNHIIYVKSYGKQSVLLLVNQDQLTVDIAYQEVLKLIKEA